MVEFRVKIHCGINSYDESSTGFDTVEAALDFADQYVTGRSIAKNPLIVVEKVETEWQGDYKDLVISRLQRFFTAFNKIPIEKGVLTIERRDEFFKVDMQFFDKEDAEKYSGKIKGISRDLIKSVSMVAEWFPNPS